MHQFGIIGCGSAGIKHAEAIAKIASLKAVCDPISDKRNQLSHQYNATAYENLDSLLKEEPGIDLIVVASPNGLHAEHTIKALQAGKHVICEMPLCITSDAARQMFDTAYFFRRKLIVVNRNRYNKKLLLLKQSVQENKLGKILGFSINCSKPKDVYVDDWRSSQHLGGGLLYTEFSDLMHLLYWLLGEVEKTAGFKKNFTTGKNLEAEAAGAIALLMHNNILGSLHYTINDRSPEINFMLIGDKGRLKISGPDLTRIEWKLAGTEKWPAYENISSSQEPFSYDHFYIDLPNALKQPFTASSEAGAIIKTTELIEKIYSAISETTSA